MKDLKDTTNWYLLWLDGVLNEGEAVSDVNTHLHIAISLKRIADALEELTGYSRFEAEKKDREGK